ncbi:ADP-ribosylglycohydrolase family protein [Streptomyces camelliae]|uniref:ADP-ribosylglycohydrolase family protein n=1 Tax=Streptomyces camelliae TaxID=3004093 RepID=A0ABY7P8P5_9ACTN|nr:ADP-ribosylglycohydrolase family protein [Streptomyces sp. HUAS 2-6]WBO66936.1 ADP-ribosylglycohydrolase family protein [Streptomyces sp. HUAS 2-6]
MLRLTWVQPEDLLGHELRQARLDGREPSAIEARWRAAGGPDAPERAGASPHRASRYLRLLAEDLLDELADLPSRLMEDEPTDLEKIKSLCAHWPATPVRRRGPDPTALEAAWLGRAIGCLLGKPVEKLSLDGIRALAGAAGNWPLTTYFTAVGVPGDLLAAHPWNRRSAATSLAENIDGMPEDDDLNYPLLNLLLLQRHGRSFTTMDVARLWLDELPPGRVFTAERIAYRNLLTGIEPPHTARHRNPFREWIGALIRADVHGWTNPGDPAAAAEQAYRDAVLTHTANGVYAAMFTAAVIAVAATGSHDVHACLRAGRGVIPPRSRLAKAIDRAIQLATHHSDFTDVVDELHATYAPAHHWVHAIPNTALTVAALTHADGDFGGSICHAVSGGWDTDSNGATAGSVAGLLAGGPAALPEHWRAPLKNRLASTVADFDGTGFDTLAHLTHLETARP